MTPCRVPRAKFVAPVPVSYAVDHPETMRRVDHTVLLEKLKR